MRVLRRYSAAKKACAAEPSPEAAFGQHADVAAGAEAARAVLVVDDDELDFGIVRPGFQRGVHRQAHLLVEGVQRGGTVQPDAPGGALAVDDDVGHAIPFVDPNYRRARQDSQSSQNRQKSSRSETSALLA